VAFRTATEVLGILDVIGGRPHVLVVRTKGHELEDAIVHRTQDLVRADLTTIRNIPVTTATRTIVDIGLTITDLDLEHLLHTAVHRGLTTIDRVTDTYRRVSRRGRNGAGPIRDLLAAYGSDPSAESRLEVRILHALRDHGVPEPVRQHPVTVDGEEFRVDLAYPDHRVFLEGDGFGVHGGRTAFEDDRHRQNLLVLDGWWPLRFTWRQAKERPAWCADVVRRKLAEIERSRR
jgi:very-short-patch-repair endonuclease